jgi:hypothetical protein
LASKSADSVMEVFSFILLIYYHDLLGLCIAL